MSGLKPKTMYKSFNPYSQSTTHQMTNEIRQIPITELIKIQDFVNDTPSNSNDNSYLSDGEVLDHVMDKLNHLTTATPYIDQWANERFINKIYNNKPHTK